MNRKRQIANIIFFARHDEPRDPDLDLFGTFEKQMESVAQRDFPATFLLEYDCLIDPKYTDAVKNRLPARCEVGGWFEIVKPLAEKAGLPWRGRPGYAWDWHAHVGFSVGYTPEERRRLVDVFMEEFKAVFGRYPACVGSWIIDAQTLRYMHERYGIVGSCNCRDQWGTDGYSFWGGYWGQGYYPSRYNVFCPAGSAETQIPVPVFRMLGSDPIYQYDMGLEYTETEGYRPGADQGVVTLEPVYVGGEGGGGVPHWVSWYFRENFNPQTLSFNYCQVGQENSFGWAAMEGGLSDQFEQLEQLRRAGKVELLTLGDTARWFRETFPLTPPATVTAGSDWRPEDLRRTLWYHCRRYRINFMVEGNRFWIRDFHLFDDRYPERYLNSVCETETMAFDNLPVADGYLWSGGRVRAGLYLVDAQGREPTLRSCDIEYPCDTEAVIRVDTETGDRFEFVCGEDRFEIRGPEDFSAEIRAGRVADLSDVDGRELRLKHNGYAYRVPLSAGTYEKTGDEKRLVIRSERGRAVFETAARRFTEGEA